MGSKIGLEMAKTEIISQVWQIIMIVEKFWWQNDKQKVWDLRLTFSFWEINQHSSNTLLVKVKISLFETTYIQWELHWNKGYKNIPLKTEQISIVVKILRLKKCSLFLLEFYDNLILRDGPSIFNLDSLHFARTTGNTDYSHIFIWII